jgi:hypothetical protein
MKERQKIMKDVTMKQIELIKQPTTPHYNLYSVLMIGAGGLGMSLILKYQKEFSKVLPEFMVFEAPYPDDQEKTMIGRQSLYYYSQSMYFQALAGWTVVFLRRSRMVSPIYYIMVSMGFLTATYLTDYYKHP